MIDVVKERLEDIKPQQHQNFFDILDANTLKNTLISEGLIPYQIEMLYT